MFFSLGRGHNYPKYHGALYCYDVPNIFSKALICPSCNGAPKMSWLGCFSHLHLKGSYRRQKHRSLAADTAPRRGWAVILLESQKTRPMARIGRMQRSSVENGAFDDSAHLRKPALPVIGESP